MKRQQVISRFFTPKPAASPGAVPARGPPCSSAASSDPVLPKQSFSSAGVPPLASRAPASSSSPRPVNGSRDFSEDFSFGSTRQRSSRKRLQDEVEDNVEDHSLVEGSQQERAFPSGWCFIL